MACVCVPCPCCLRVACVCASVLVACVCSPLLVACVCSPVFVACVCLLLFLWRVHACRLCASYAHCVCICTPCQSEESKQSLAKLIKTFHSSAKSVLEPLMKMTAAAPTPPSVVKAEKVDKKAEKVDKKSESVAKSAAAGSSQVWRAYARRFPWRAYVCPCSALACVCASLPLACVCVSAHMFGVACICFACTCVPCRCGLLALFMAFCLLIASACRSTPVFQHHHRRQHHRRRHHGRERDGRHHRRKNRLRPRRRHARRCVACVCVPCRSYACRVCPPPFACCCGVRMRACSFTRSCLLLFAP